MYNQLSSDYDRFVNWQNRLAIELPFLLKHLQQTNARSILDAGTGTGMHAIALAQLGFEAAGADISPGMIERARQNAATAGVSVRFEITGFGELSGAFGTHTFDAVLCLGNSLPHLLSQSDLERALCDFANCLQPGGALFIQNRNFDGVIQHQERWMEPQSHSEPGAEWIYQRFYDFDPDGLLTFNMVTLKRVVGGVWSQQVAASRLRPLLQADLLNPLSEAGFTDHQSFGSMSGDVFNPEESGNLIILTHLPH